MLTKAYDLKDVILTSSEARGKDLAWAIGTLGTARQILRPHGLRMTSQKMLRFVSDLTQRSCVFIENSC